MKILITNDDGINAEGIRHLVEFAKTKGEVVVCAPKYEQSAKSHAIEIREAFEIKKVDLFDGVRAYSIDSTPADCVRFAFLGLKEKFDIVLSGINRGPNLGLDLVYSATLGAVFEAGRLGVSGIAFSTNFDSFDNAKRTLPAIYEEFERRSLLSKNQLYNVNIPSTETKGIRYTTQGGIYYTDEFVPLGRDDLYRQDGHCAYQGTKNLCEDIDAFSCGYVSITPLSKSRTATDVLYKLQSE